jgi:hypothetical protein
LRVGLVLAGQIVFVKRAKLNNTRGTPGAVMQYKSACKKRKQKAPRIYESPGYGHLSYKG